MIGEIIHKETLQLSMWRSGNQSFFNFIHHVTNDLVSHWNWGRRYVCIWSRIHHNLYICKFRNLYHIRFMKYNGYNLVKQITHLFCSYITKNYPSEKISTWRANVKRDPPVSPWGVGRPPRMGPSGRMANPDGSMGMQLGSPPHRIVSALTMSIGA